MSISINGLFRGQVVYDAHREKAGNTTMMRMGVWDVIIQEVDIGGSRVLASWNGNAAKWHYARGGKFPWRKSDPRAALKAIRNKALDDMVAASQALGLYE